MSTAVASSGKSTNGRSSGEVPSLIRGYFRLLSAVAPGLAERHATRLFFTPQRRVRRPPGVIAGVAPEAFRVRTGGDTLRAWRYGRGPAVVFVHGWGGSAHDWPALAARVIEGGYAAVLADFPAHGLATGRRTNLLRMERALHALANDLAFSGHHRFEPLEAVVAHSFGGAATALALRDGLLARSVVMLAPVAHPMSFLDPVAHALGLSRARRDGMRERIRAIVGGDLERIAVVPAIGTARVRGLVVHDRGDAAVPWTHGRDVAGAWEGAEHLWTEGLGHRGVLRDEAVMSRVVEFITRGARAERESWSGMGVLVAR